MKLAIHKKEQGRATRLAAFLIGLVVAFWGCNNLYWALPRPDVAPGEEVPWWGRTILGPFDLFGVSLQVNVILLGVTALFLVAAFALYLAFNQAKVSDFLIETEGELKKVSWPEPREYLSASVAVFIVVVFLVLTLWVFDLLLSWFLGDILGIGF
jgi:preprotein translocase SecE subunit